MMLIHFSGTGQKANKSQSRLRWGHHHHQLPLAAMHPLLLVVHHYHIVSILKDSAIFILNLLKLSDLETSVKVDSILKKISTTGLIELVFQIAGAS